jgi:glycosyltransferase involved in cell wall biosynthesis
MCTFNGRRFLPAQLDSIAAQDRLPDELVICDDGSSDGTAEIAHEFAQRAPFSTRLVVNGKNLGSTKNFEQAISLCQGTIVALADQDDVWYRHKLSRIEKAFLHSSATVAVFSDADVIDHDSRLLGLRLWSSFSFDLRKQRQFANGHALNVLLRHPVVTGATMAFRRNLFDLVSPIPSDDIHDRWISFLLAARGQFDLIADPLMQYRQHQGQQEGLPPAILGARMARARSRGGDAYLQEIKEVLRIREWLERRRSDFQKAEYALEEINGKISHLEHRARLPRTKIARIPKILREILNLHYWRYSGGWISIGKDLLIR